MLGAINTLSTEFFLERKAKRKPRYVNHGFLFRILCFIDMKKIYKKINE